MFLKAIIAASQSRPLWGEFQTGWGNAVFVVTSQGLAALQPVTTDAAFEQLLSEELEPAGIRPLTPGQRTLWCQKLSEALVQPQLIASLPLDLQGTAFQKAVWEALLTIPAGQTRSYSQLAEQVGQPAAVRAVASACGANPVALLVPCHRVVRKDGGLGGYRWGLDMKRRLLQREGAI
ncbi:methylated-DNA--[protein]-cysteine S-methyltransferase [Marinospirillum perlucidum]|uniref:methylated-DNA--[protein]-cysteine S-methyltransferase n=1 Tax=Marinospirillum perlucidum TaxID=1982602 RepID=UPI000DF150FD